MSSAPYRIEHDTLGEVKVPQRALWGAQTQRAIENFPVSGLREPDSLVRSYLMIKRASAVVNRELGALDADLGAAIVAACDEILANPSRFREQFVVDVFQAGAGTSLNMNCNEVVANVANAHLGGAAGSNSPIHPNDHVNMSQSTNDTFPAAMRVAMLHQLGDLGGVLDVLASAFAERGDAFADVIKPGRTHLQDAVPVTLGQEFDAWGAAVRRAARLLGDAADELAELGLGGTATGTGVNTPRGFREAVVAELARATGLALRPIDDLREGMQSQLPVAAVSGALRNLALELTRIANDLRLLASGPLTGIAEVRLPAVQPGSSIMPGKVNPSMLECLNQICFHVIGADTAVAYAVQAGQLELNVMMPLVAWEVLFSIEILKNFLPVLVQKCIAGIEADRERCEMLWTTSPALATLLNPVIGYESAAVVAKESLMTRVPIPELVRSRGLLSSSRLREMLSLRTLTGTRARRRKRR